MTIALLGTLVNAAGGPLWGLVAGDDGKPNNFGDTRTGSLAGPIPLVIIVILGAVTAFLIWNMNRRLKRLPKAFGVDSSPAAKAEDPPASAAPSPPSA